MRPIPCYEVGQPDCRDEPFRPVHGSNHGSNRYVFALAPPAMTTAADCLENLLGIAAGTPAPASDVEPDEKLVRRVLAGDREAEELLYRRHVRYIGGLLVRLLGSRGEAEDAVQETFVIALERLATLRDPGSLRAWLAQIAVSRARRRFRRRRLLRALGLDGAHDDVDLDALAAAETTADVRADISTLVELLGRLPANERIAWSLRNIEGQALDEVANSCNCSLATAKRRIARADGWIRERYAEPEGAS